jgi:threonine/homoserine/homoserine lactone efflux protein
MLLKGAGEGFLISLFNPKIALFFLAIFSHLVHSDSSWIETGLMGITAAVIDACWYVSVALMLTGTNLIKVFRDRETVIQRVSGTVLILIAVYLLVVMLRGLL